MKNDVHSWFMSHNGETRDGITLKVSPDHRRQAYHAEYRWGHNLGFNSRWQIEEVPDSQHFCGFKTQEDVQVVVDELFEYAAKLRSYLSGKDYV